MKSRNQSGSAHVVVIIILVAALIFALGFVLWQNFILAPAATVQETSTTTETDETTEPAGPYVGWTERTIEAGGESVSFMLPPEWEVTELVPRSEEFIYEGFTLKSVDDFTLTLALHNSPRGWTVDSPRVAVLDSKMLTNNLGWVVVSDIEDQTVASLLYLDQTFDGPLLQTGDSTLAGANLVSFGTASSEIKLETSGSYASALPLAEFTSKESVKQAKLVLESIELK